jgi:hypothetical protein
MVYLDLQVAQVNRVQWVILVLLEALASLDLGVLLVSQVPLVMVVLKVLMERLVYLATKDQQVRKVVQVVLVIRVVPVLKVLLDTGVKEVDMVPQDLMVYLEKGELLATVAPQVWQVNLALKELTGLMVKEAPVGRMEQLERLADQGLQEAMERLALLV